jgi:hypothetical protein
VAQSSGEFNATKTHFGGIARQGSQMGDKSAGGEKLFSFCSLGARFRVKERHPTGANPKQAHG